MRKNITILFLIAIIAVSGCKSTENTFTKVYERKLAIKPNRVGAFSRDGSGFFGVEGSSNSGLLNPGEAIFVNAETGETVWTQKIKELGEIGADPSNIQVIWEEGVALFFTKGLTNFRLSCIDMESKEELWHKEEGKPGQYGYGVNYVASAGGIIHPTPEGLSMYDVRTGEVLWERTDIRDDLDFGDFLVNDGEAEKTNWLYLDDADRFLLSGNEKVALLNPHNGNYEWEINQPIGSVNNADVFEDEGVALFYGSENESLAKSLVKSSNTTAGSIMRTMESGLVEKPIINVNLKTGNIAWENEFRSGQNDQVFMFEDKILLTNLVTYVFDRSTGEVVWQNVSRDRLENEDNLKMLSSFTGFDLDAGDRVTPEDIIMDNSVIAIYPQFFEKTLNQNDISIHRYDLNSGEALWKTEPIRTNPHYFFLEKERLFLLSGRVIPNTLHVIDPQTGEELFKIEERGMITKTVVTDQTLYLLFRSRQMKAYDLGTGEQLNLEKPYGEPTDLRNIGNYLFAAYDDAFGSDIMAFHEKNSFAVEKKLEVPEYFGNFVYKGDNFFLKADNDRQNGIIALDLENLRMKGYIMSTAQGSFTSNGEDQIFKDYYLHITRDGQYLFEIDGEAFNKYRVD